MKRGNEGVIISFYYYKFKPSDSGFTILLANETETMATNCDDRGKNWSNRYGTMKRGVPKMFSS